MNERQRKKQHKNPHTLVVINFNNIYRSFATVIIIWCPNIHSRFDLLLHNPKLNISLITKRWMALLDGIFSYVPRTPTKHTNGLMKTKSKIEKKKRNNLNVNCDHCDTNSSHCSDARAHVCMHLCIRGEYNKAHDYHMRARLLLLLVLAHTVQRDRSLRRSAKKKWNAFHHHCRHCALHSERCIYSDCHP